MHLAVLNGHTEMLKAMIDAGADINVRRTLRRPPAIRPCTSLALKSIRIALSFLWTEARTTVSAT
ncbi:MAG: hypothetical protein K2K28_04395 [Clostridia bacterium]|nr:hypothetical protein [Clostridia bacterium]